MPSASARFLVSGAITRWLGGSSRPGLLRAERTPGGHRDYPEAAVDRVIRIQELFAAGLHSSRIAQLLPCMRDADGGPSAVATPRLVRDLTAADRATPARAVPHRSPRLTPERTVHQEAAPGPCEREPYC